jgi:dimethylargininase
MRVALTRDVSPNLGGCELTHLPRETINPVVARVQHREYESCLVRLGCEVRRIPPAPDLPDAVFVEDTAVVLDELAVITRPGADSRKPETGSVAESLRPFRALRSIEAPGTLDGGDVLTVGRHLFVGRSNRTDAAGIEQLRSILTPHGYRVTSVELTGCLHLKSAVTNVGKDVLLLNSAWVDPGSFPDQTLIDVDASEPFAANALLVNDTVLYPAAYPKTRIRLEAHGVRIATVDVSELAKAEGGVTCCSLIFEASATPQAR